jgi:phospholipase/lecithinase/hemolysin
MVSLAVTGVSAQAASVNYNDAFTSYFAFGDSLTDDGKAPELAPPSFGGRFSNGITYAEHIAQDFAADGRFSANFAIGGATAENDNETQYPTTEGAVIGTFAGQIGVFDFQRRNTALGSLVGDNPLVSVLFGANDVFQDFLEGSTVGEIGRNAADAVKTGIQAIAGLGSQFDDFVVINLPDLSQTPQFSGTLAAPLVQAEAFAFNQQLALNMQSLRNQGLNIYEVDQAAFLAGVLANPGSLNITEVAIPCTTSLVTLDPLNNCSITADGVDLSLADSFLFVDPVHPNRVVQKAFADEVRAALTPVPLPAGLPLLLAGVAAFALMWRTRQA